MLTELEGSDWAESFKYAGSTTDGHSDSPNSGPTTFPGSKTSCAPFSRSDVAELFGQHDDGSDEPTFRCWGRLHDGRFFYLEAGCDYTGWG